MIDIKCEDVTGILTQKVNDDFLRDILKENKQTSTKENNKLKHLTMTIKIIVIWDVTPYSLADSHRTFGRRILVLSRWR